MTRCPEEGCKFTTFASEKALASALAQHKRQWHERRNVGRGKDLDLRGPRQDAKQCV